MNEIKDKQIHKKRNTDHNNFYEKNPNKSKKRRINTIRTSRTEFIMVTGIKLTKKIVYIYK